MPSKRIAPFLLLVSSLFLAAGCSSDDVPSTPAGKPAMDSLVSAEWLKEHLDDPDLVVLDASVPVESDGEGGFRTVSGRAQYEAGHIPTAGFADLKGELADPNSPNGFAVPSPEQFATLLDETRPVAEAVGRSM